ncbi:MAG: hypothetical protein AB3N13_13185, partial [Arenibacterium sp.]
GTKGLNHTPLTIRENKSARVHSNLLFWKVESELRPNGNPECPQTLELFKFYLKGFGRAIAGLSHAGRQSVQGLTCRRSRLSKEQGISLLHNKKSRSKTGAALKILR